MARQALSDPAARNVARVYRWALAMGWTEAHAASWAAYTVGLRLVHGPRVLSPWSLAEIQSLLFLRSEWRAGRWRG